MSSFTFGSAFSFGNPGNDQSLRCFGDFTEDGIPDLLLFSTSRHVVGFWQTNGAQPPVLVPLTQVSGTWTPVGAENLDGDGNAKSFGARSRPER